MEMQPFQNKIIFQENKSKHGNSRLTCLRNKKWRIVSVIKRINAMFFGIKNT